MEKEASVTEIVNALGLTQSAVSHQLRILKDAHVLKSDKVGKMVFYSLNDEHVRIIVETGHVHMNHKE
jgi:ArsR family transcriptional regulator